MVMMVVKVVMMVIMIMLVVMVMMVVVMKVVVTFASALVLSRIDYINMALVTLPKVVTQSIQSIINTTARLITGVRKYDHISPVLEELRWLYDTPDQTMDQKVFHVF